MKSQAKLLTFTNYREILTPGLIDEERLMFLMNVPLEEPGLAFLMVSIKLLKFSINLSSEKLTFPIIK